MDDEGVTFLSEPLKEDLEITGPLASKLFVSSSTADADLFVIFRVFTPDLREVTFRGAMDPHTPVSQGWLRVSHRKLDPNESTFYQPCHTHDEIQPMAPGEVYEADIEQYSTCIIVPAGFRLGYTVRGKDYKWQSAEAMGKPKGSKEFLGCAIILHNDPQDRPRELMNGEVTLHIGPDRAAYVLVPIIPKGK
jgi:predicted acyl esterase